MSTLSRPTRALLTFCAVGFLLLPSCALAVGAALGAGGVYAMGDDAARVYLDAPMADVVSASQALLEEGGTIERDDPGEKESVLEGRSDDYRYTIELTALTENTTELVVHARRWAKLAPAQEEAKRLADRIAYRVDA